MFWRKKKGNPLHGADQALREAREALEEVRGEREDVVEVSSFHRAHRLDNHWSKRVDLFLKGHNT